MVLGPENSKKLISAQEATASGLMAVATAMEKNNKNIEKMISVKEKMLELENRKTVAFESLVLHIVTNINNNNNNDDDDE